MKTYQHLPFAALLVLATLATSAQEISTASAQPKPGVQSLSPVLQQLLEAAVATAIDKSGETKVIQTNQVAQVLLGILNQAMNRPQPEGGPLAPQNQGTATEFQRVLEAVLAKSLVEAGSSQTNQVKELVDSLMVMVNQSLTKNPAGAQTLAGKFHGRFSSDAMVVESLGRPGRYAGTIRLGDQSFKFAAAENGDQLQGKFESIDAQFDFIASLDGNALVLVSGDTRYELQRERSAVASAYAGRFAGEGLQLDSQGDAGLYAGVVRLGEASYDFTGRENNGVLQGSFATADAQFEFEATLAGAQVTFVTGDTRYQLARQDAGPASGRPVNPLARAPGTVPPPLTVTTPPVTFPAPGRTPLPVPRPPVTVTTTPLPTQLPKPPMTTSQKNPFPQPATVKTAPAWANVFRHESGGSFRYPDGWTARQDEQLGGILLTPKDAPGAQQEILLVSGEEAEDITRPDDPRIVQAIEALVQQAGPGLRRAGPPELMKAGSRPAMQLTWDGADQGGNPYRVRVYTTILGKFVISLSALGRRDRVEARDPVLRQIFDTFDMGGNPAGGPVATPAGVKPGPAGQAAPGVDLRLVGTWMKFEFKAIGNSSREKTTYAVLRQDGSALFTENSESAHSFQFRNQQGTETGRANVAGQNAGASRGRWQTAGNRLTITTDAGEREQFSYEIRPNSTGFPILRLQPVAGGKVEEWSKQK